MYVALAQGYTIRNDQECSYLIAINRMPDTADIELGGLAIPSFMGWIISNLGSQPYDENVDAI